MKYKDLYVGDWFTYNGFRYIKTCDYTGGITDVSLNPQCFGRPILFSIIEDDKDVEFLTEISYKAPFSSFAENIQEVPNFALCHSLGSNKEYFIVFDGFKIIIKSSNPADCGKWLPINRDDLEEINMMVVATIKYEDNA